MATSNGIASVAEKGPFPHKIMNDLTRRRALRVAAQALGCDEDDVNFTASLDDTVSIHEAEQRTLVTDLAGFLEAMGLEDDADTRESFERWRAVHTKAGLWLKVN